MKKTFSFNPKSSGENAIEISVFYKKKGMNWYNSQNERGGFYVSFNAGTKETRDGYTTFSFMMFEGFKYLLLEAERDNKKKTQMLLNKVVDEKLAKMVFDENNEEAVEYIKEKLK